MTLNYAIPANIIMEIVMIAVESAVYAYSHDKLMYARIDQIYIGFAVPFLIFSFAWAIYFKPEGRDFPRKAWSRYLRATQGIVLILIGCMTFVSAQTIEDSDTCSYYEMIFGLHCQRYEAKLVAGLLAVLDSVFYFLRPCKFHPPPNTSIDVTSPQVIFAPNFMNQESPPPYFPSQAQPGTYFVQYQPGNPQVVSQEIQFGYYLANPNHAQFQGGVQQTQT
ncbi:unnamed protein product [Allacma fusca]|uniref:Uncharacterized protein n=1 Tax=Allacma fusca TaxID=39272 RepID=A0A8J2JGZ8_9HEXA|nr:unnamed protein product [Allacma fusca]